MTTLIHAEPKNGKTNYIIMQMLDPGHEADVYLAATPAEALAAFRQAEARTKELGMNLSVRELSALGKRFVSLNNLVDAPAGATVHVDDVDQILEKLLGREVGVITTSVEHHFIQRPEGITQ